jgi:anti-sigma-K factor RskA
MPEKLHPTTLLEDYSLGLLEPEELKAVEAHVATCQQCQAEVRKLDAVLVAWAERMPEVKPSSTPWEKLGARLAADREQGKEGTESFVLPEIAAPTPKAEPDTSFLPTLPAPPPFRNVWLTTAAMLVVTVGSLFWGWRNQQTAQLAQNNERLVAEFLQRPEVSKITLYGNGNETLGTVLKASDEAVFVLSETAPSGQTYQAWGHTNDDWQPGSNERLTSLGLSNNGVFKISTAGFAALYLSVEPSGGSDQPTQPIARVMLASVGLEQTITLLTPEDHATLTNNTTIVRGELSSGVRGLSYRVNGGEEIPVAISNSSFTFTVSSFQTGENRLELIAQTADGALSTQTLTLTRGNKLLFR